jgi:hypothetical protein
MDGFVKLLPHSSFFYPEKETQILSETSVPVTNVHGATSLLSRVGYLYFVASNRKLAIVLRIRGSKLTENASQNYVPHPKVRSRIGFPLHFNITFRSSNIPRYVFGQFFFMFVGFDMQINSFITFFFKFCKREIFLVCKRVCVAKNGMTVQRTGGILRQSNYSSFAPKIITGYCQVTFWRSQLVPASQGLLYLICVFKCSHSRCACIKQDDGDPSNTTILKYTTGCPTTYQTRQFFNPAPVP